MIRGHLFDDHFVNLDPRTAGYGGSWVPNSGDPLQAYGQDMLRLFWNELRNIRAPQVLDIGANTGSFCLLAGQCAGAYVYAFEPVLEIYDILCANITANDLCNRVRAVPLALSDRQGQREMTIPVDRIQAGLSFMDNRAPDMPCFSELVSATTLDAFCEGNHVGHVDFIKMDVEGVESTVLRGGERTIRRDMPAILLEATNTHLTLPILEGWGYVCHDFTSDILARRKDYA